MTWSYDTFFYKFAMWNARGELFNHSFEETLIEFSYHLHNFEEATDLLRSVSLQIYFILYFSTLSQTICVLTLGRIPSLILTLGLTTHDNIRFRSKLVSFWLFFLLSHTHLKLKLLFFLFEIQNTLKLLMRITLLLSTGNDKRDRKSVV